MQKASRLLETSHAGVAEVAKRVGHDAEAAFSKAFKRWIGVAPGAYRRTAGARPAEAPSESPAKRRSRGQVSTCPHGGDGEVIPVSLYATD
jgi:AraC-like DNA-binding protein